MVVAGAPGAALHVVFQCRVVPGHLRHGGARPRGEAGAPQVRVEHHAGAVDDPAQGGELRGPGPGQRVLQDGLPAGEGAQSAGEDALPEGVQGPPDAVPDRGGGEGLPGDAGGLREKLVHLGDGAEKVLLFHM